MKPQTGSSQARVHIFPVCFLQVGPGLNLLSWRLVGFSFHLLALLASSILSIEDHFGLEVQRLTTLNQLNSPQRKIFFPNRGKIDPAVWYIAIGSSHPGGAGAAKGWVVHPLKTHVSWVQNVAISSSSYFYLLVGTI